MGVPIGNERIDRSSAIGNGLTCRCESTCGAEATTQINHTTSLVTIIRFCILVLYGDEQLCCPWSKARFEMIRLIRTVAEAPTAPSVVHQSGKAD